jgi:hypothetical protein
MAKISARGAVAIAVATKGGPEGKTIRTLCSDGRILSRLSVTRENGRSWSTGNKIHGRLRDIDTDPEAVERWIGWMSSRGFEVTRVFARR